jgi:hypothetical protein
MADVNRKWPYLSNQVNFRFNGHHFPGSDVGSQVTVSAPLPLSRASLKTPVTPFEFRLYHPYN